MQLRVSSTTPHGFIARSTRRHFPIRSIAPRQPQLFGYSIRIHTRRFWSYERVAYWWHIGGTLAAHSLLNIGLRILKSWNSHGPVQRLPAAFTIRAWSAGSAAEPFRYRIDDTSTQPQSRGPWYHPSRVQQLRDILVAGSLEDR